MDTLPFPISPYSILSYIVLWNPYKCPISLWSRLVSDSEALWAFSVIYRSKVNHKWRPHEAADHFLSLWTSHRSSWPSELPSRTHQPTVAWISYSSSISDKMSAPTTVRTFDVQGSFWKPFIIIWYHNGVCWYNAALLWLLQLDLIIIPLFWPDLWWK